MNKPKDTVVIDQQATHKLKGGITAMVAIGLLLLLSIGTTFAMMIWTGNQTPNRFTMAEKLTCDLLEPAWTNAALTDNGLAVTADSKTSIDSDKLKYVDAVNGVGIPKGAAQQVPGSEFKKNPFVVNTTTISSDALSDPDDVTSGYGFAGMKITFQRVWSSDGKYHAMTDDEVQKLFACYYFGKVVTSTTGTGSSAVTTQTQPTSDTKAGWGGENNDQLGENWYQLTGATYNNATANHVDGNGAMYFISSKRLEPLGKTVYNHTDKTKTVTEGGETVTVEDRDDITISTTFGKVTETATSDTWGYDATSTSKYATTPLFGCVRYIDKADQKAIAEMKNMLDENGAVSSAGKTPGWRMIISCGIIDSADEDDSVLSSGAVDTSTNWYKDFKKVLDDAETDSKEQASGIRASADTKLGAYAVKGNTKVTAGTGVPEVYVAPTD